MLWVSNNRPDMIRLLARCHKRKLNQMGYGGSPSFHSFLNVNWDAFDSMFYVVSGMFSRGFSGFGC